MEGLRPAIPMWLTGWNALAAVGFVLAAWGAQPQRERWLPALWLAWAAQGVALALDIGGLGLEAGGARFGFAPALSLMFWVVWLVVLLESRFLPLHFMRRALALGSVVAVSLAAVFPGQPVPAPTPWAPLHWMLGLASYGLMATAVLHSLLLARAERQLRHPMAGAEVLGLPVLRLERLTFQFVAAGVVSLSLALLLGVAEGQPWRWDHKTVFSLSAWAVLVALLAGRFGLGWRGVSARRWLYVGAGLLLMAYAGSRFVGEVLLNRSV